MKSEDAQLWSDWFAYAGEPAIDRALRKLYNDLDDAVASRGPTCWISGRCCQFDTFDHLLYVTGLEVAWVMRQLDDARRDALRRAPLPSTDACPFQHDKLCGIRAIRPLGCRVFFCDPNAQAWQNPLYEQFLTRLRQLHDEHGVEYRYMEWRGGLKSAREHAF